MPRKKTAKTTKTKKAQQSSVELRTRLSAVKNFKLNRRVVLIALVLLGLILLAYYKRGWFVAATVNGTPISNFEVLSALNKQYRTQTLNQMINEKILEQEAKKNGIVVAQPEIDQKIAEVENQYGGRDTFNNLLSQQGVSRDEFIRQTRLQLIVEKLYANEASPSAEEIQKYMDENKDLPEATEPAKFRQTAEQTLKQQKLSSTFNQKFQALRKAANIKIY